MNEKKLKIRSIINSYTTLLVIALLVFSIFTGFMAYNSFAENDVIREERKVSSWESIGGFTYSSEVVESNLIFPRGERLENKRFYFTNISPVINGEFNFGYISTDNGSVDIEANLFLIIQSIQERVQKDESDIIYWQRRDLLNKKVRQSVGPNENLTVPFSINIKENRILESEIAESLGAPKKNPRGLTRGEIKEVVRAKVDIAGNINGEDVDQNFIYNLNIRTKERMYEVNGSSHKTSSFENTAMIAVKNSSGGIISSIIPVSLFLISLLSLLVLSFLGGILPTTKNRLKLSSKEKELLKYYKDRNEFDEWITQINLPDDVKDKPKAKAESLGDLVDLAIDTNNAVIENPGSNIFYVVQEDYVYTYSIQEP